MFLLRNVLCIVISLTATCVALTAYHDNAGGGNVATSLLPIAAGERHKRGVDVAQLLRNILLQSAQASDFKANITRAAARPAPTRRPTARPRPPAPPPTPRRISDPFNIFAFKNKFIPFNPIDYGDYDDPMPQTPAPRPRPRPRPSPTTTMAPTTTAAPQPPPPPPPRPRPMPRRRPPPPPARPIHRFGNPYFGADYDYYQNTNQNLGGDYDYEQDQQPPAPQPPPRRRPASPPAPPPPPPAAAPASPRGRPTQLRNRVVYQYAQPADPSYDDADPNAGQDDAVDYTDVATPDDSNTANNDDAAAADPGADADYADNAADANPPDNNDDGDDTTADDQSTAQQPPIPPRRPQQQQDFSPFDYNLGSNGGVGSSSLSYVPQQGSYEFRNQFANFKTNFDGGYPKPSYNDGQYYSYYK